MILVACLGGCLMGLGLVIMLAELRPAPARLADVLARLEGSEPTAQPCHARWVPAVVRRTGLHVPSRDLHLLGISTDSLLTKRIAYLLLGLVFPTLLNLMTTVAMGNGVPWQVPAGAGVLFGGLFAIAPDIAVRRQAAELRREFRAVLATYLDLVALERAAGAGSSEALYAPADVCVGWVFGRIHAVLEHARRSGEQPWRGLADLGRRVGVVELTELADIAEDAGSVGAQVMPTLLAKAAAMRTAALTEARARANSRTSEMPVAIAMSISGFLLLVTFPAIYRLFIS